MAVQIFTFFIIFLIVICIPLAIIESTRVRLFSRRWYKLGLPVYRNALVVPQIQTERLTKEVYTKDEGVYYFAEDGNIYFRSLTAQGRWTVRTPFPFKCTATLINMDTLEITARIPLTATVFFSCFTVLGIFFSLVPGSQGILFVIIPVALFWVSYTLEKKRLRIMLAELRYLLATGKG